MSTRRGTIRGGAQRSVEKSLIERVEAALETVVILAHAAHDRYARLGYRRMASRADAVLDAVEKLRATMASVLTGAPRDELLFEIREELRARVEDGIQAPEIRRGRHAAEVLLLGARLRHAGGPPRKWVGAEQTLKRLQSLEELQTPIERLQDSNVASVWSFLIERGPMEGMR